ncbi:aspartate kinase [Oceanobacillus halotolerans]|uniref:aspartate kinase n=1 Tax=Oceanobacillus halotolerans TaxID=2663380 RepID=UPI0013DC3D9A|nr:aspartate kinase [Oceanobacillus halotolerans]
MKVAKFGGSSVASATQIKKVGSIIQEDPQRKFIVVSAPGKRHGNDEKITDLLIKLADTHFQHQPIDAILNKIMNRFSEIIEGLQLSKAIIDDILQSIKSILSSTITDERKADRLKSIGEDSSAKIVSAYLSSLGLKANYVNPKDAGIMVSNEPGNAQILSESFAKLYKLRETQGIQVIPGFFGYTADDELVTFSRGGSDITGSIVAAGVKASLYENFTDVDSVYTVNPQIVQDPKEITSLTYKEMRELSYAGFSVFHDEALIPAFKEKIPVCIKNTNNPKAPGTMIVSSKLQAEKCVVGIASDTEFCNLYVSKYLMNRELGFGRKLFQILEDENISFEHAPSGIDDMSVILRQSQLTLEKETTIVERIKNELHPDIVSIERDLAMIMIVGEGIMSTVGIAQKATSAFSEANVNIEMINQGSSEVSMMFGIKAEGLNRAIQSLYRVFFT